MTGGMTDLAQGQTVGDRAGGRFGDRGGVPTDEPPTARLNAADFAPWSRTRPNAMALLAELAADGVPSALLSPAPGRPRAASEGSRGPPASTTCCSPANPARPKRIVRGGTPWGSGWAPEPRTASSWTTAWRTWTARAGRDCARNTGPAPTRHAAGLTTLGLLS